MLEWTQKSSISNINRSIYKQGASFQKARNVADQPRQETISNILRPDQFHAAESLERSWSLFWGKRNQPTSMPHNFFKLSHFISINPLNKKRRLFYLKAQFVPRSKHFSSRL